MNTTEKQLRDNCLAIAAELSGEVKFDADEYELDEDDEQPSIYDWLGQQLSMEFKIGSEGGYLGGEVLISFGGPNIWVDTRFNQVHGSWGGDSFQCSFEDVYGLDDILEEHYNSLR